MPQCFLYQLRPVDNFFRCYQNDILQQILAKTIQAGVFQFAMITSTCLLFNDAALGTQVLAAVAIVVTRRARDFATKAIKEDKKVDELTRDVNADLNTTDTEFLREYYKKSQGEGSGPFVKKYSKDIIYYGSMYLGMKNGPGIECFRKCHNESLGRYVECQFQGKWKYNQLHGLSLLINSEVAKFMLGYYKWGKPYGIHIAWGGKVQDDTAPLEATIKYYGSEPQNKT